MDWLSGDVRTLLIIAACVPLLRFVLNLSKYLRTRWYYRRYKKWLSTSQGMKLRESRGQVVKLFKGAGVEDSFVSVAQHIGYDKLSVKEVSVFGNFPNSRDDFAAPFIAMFLEAKGTYRARMLESLNPLYWIEAIIYLLRTLLGYLDLPAEGTGVKILQLVWWIVGAVSTTALALYAAEIRTFIEGLS